MRRRRSAGARRALVGGAGPQHGGCLAAAAADRRDRRDAAALVRPGDAQARRGAGGAGRGAAGGEDPLRRLFGRQRGGGLGGGPSDVAVLQTSVNLVDQTNIDMVLPAARRNNVAVLAKRPIANSAWRGLQAFSSFYPHYVRPYWERFQKLRLTPQELGFSDERDWAEIALRFTLAQPGAHCAIIGT